MKRRYPFIAALLVFAIAFRLYSQFIYFAGFWDGFISDLQRAEIPVFEVFNGFSVAMGFWFIYLGAVARRVDIRIPFIASCLVYVLCGAVVLEIDQNFRAHLFDDRGG